jgi:hypothetical protein
MAPVPPNATSNVVRYCQGAVGGGGGGGGEGQAGGPSVPHITLDKLSQSLLSRCRRSYQDALLSKVDSAPIQDDVVDLKKSRRPRCHHHRRKHRSPALSPPLALESTTGFDEGWQVVMPHQRRGHFCAPSGSPKPLSPRYLTVVVGRCLNCLSSSHRRVDCCLPTRCFNCHGLHHHLWDFKHPQKSLASHVLGGSKVRSDVGSQLLVQARHDVSWARPASQA